MSTRSIAVVLVLIVVTYGNSERQFAGHVADATPKTPVDDDRCEAALRSLATGKLDRWHGLTARCTRGHAERALGSSKGGDAVGDLGGTPTTYRTYPATRGSLEDILVWFRDQQIVLVRVPHPVLAEPLEKSLGAPEAKQRSLLASGHTQWIYASRGIVAHVWGSDTSRILDAPRWSDPRTSGE